MYEQEAEAILNELFKEKNHTQLVFNRRKLLMENVIFGSNDMTATAIEAIKLKYDSEAEEITINDSHNQDLLLESIVKKMTDMHMQMRDTINHLNEVSMTPTKQKTYRQLWDKQMKHDENSVRLEEEIEKATHEITVLSRKRRDLESMATREINLLRREKEYFIECSIQLRETYEHEMNADKRNMHSLMDQTYKTNAFLVETERKGGLILSVAAACRKLQTEEEKVVPWKDYSEQSMQPIKLVTDKPQVNELAEMDQFWLRVSAAAAANVSLSEEKAHLQKENKMLLHKIRQYCQQADYARTIGTLKIPKKPTVVTPKQEAAHMYQLNKHSSAK